MVKTYVRQQKEREEGIKQASTLPTPEVPKLDKGNWRSVRDSFIELLSCQAGSNGVPLQYIVREGAVGYYDSIYTTLDQKLIKCTTSGETIILIFNQSIYGGEFMEDGLVNPIQCMQNDVRIDSRPRIFYPDDENSQTIQFEG
jgi:hypothetical protein